MKKTAATATPREKLLKNSLAQTAYRERKKAKGEIYFQRWVTPKLAEKLQTVYETYTTGGKIA